MRDDIELMMRVFGGYSSPSYRNLAMMSSFPISFSVFEIILESFILSTCLPDFVFWHGELHLIKLTGITILQIISELRKDETMILIPIILILDPLMYR